MTDPGRSTSDALVDLKRLATMMADALMPPCCLRCRGEVAALGTLCPACWSEIRFIARPLCDRCGLPFEIDLGPGAVCGDCAAREPAYGQARAVFLYDEASRPLVVGFKHADRTELAPVFARWMARAGAELLERADLLVPVPLHRWRLLRRRYNQSALLALALARLSGRKAAPDALSRLRATPSQGQGGRLWRARNVKGAFALSGRENVAGRRVLLIDDVLTSGATAGECVAVLRKAGAAAVDVLTLARVSREAG